MSMKLRKIPINNTDTRPVSPFSAASAKNHGKKKGDATIHRPFVFPGKFCFALSPVDKPSFFRGKNDQSLILITTFFTFSAFPEAGMILP